MTQQGFDSLQIRQERLLVLTGGIEPKELFQIKKAITSKSGTNLVLFVDLTFTDIGLLIVPYSYYASSNTAINTALGGLLAGASMAVGQSVEKKRASKKYDQSAGESHVTLPAERFAFYGEEDLSDSSSLSRISVNQHMKSEFLPADELGLFKFVKNGVIEMIFRQVTYSFEVNESVDNNLVEKWLTDAKKKRQPLSGASNRPGLASLLEWGQRTVSQTPVWVSDAIRTAVSTEEDLNTSGILRSASVKHIGSLIKKLEKIATPDAMCLAQGLKGNVSGKADRYFKNAIICAVLEGVSLLLVFYFSPFLPSSQSPHGEIGGIALIPSVVFPFVVIGFLIAGFYTRSKINQSASKMAGNNDDEVICYQCKFVQWKGYNKCQKCGMDML